MVAFNGLTAILIPHNSAKRTNHDAGPASHTFIGVIHNLPGLRVPRYSTRDAGLSAKRIIAMAALHRNRSNMAGRSPFVNALNVNTVLGQREFPDGFGQFF
jgi:hypothetical protein